MPEQVADRTWTCARCEVTASWMVGHEAPALPPNWVADNGEVFCLACRRDMAGEAGLAQISEDAPVADRQKVHAAARIDFEVSRDPDQANAKIAKACRTSIPAVRKSRERLGLDETYKEGEAR